MLRVGQKVECIKDVNAAGVSFGECLPLKGAIYTIRDIEAESTDGFLGLWLEEIVNKKHDYIQGLRECSFDERGFRPVVERKTSISFAHEILRVASEKVPA